MHLQGEQLETEALEVLEGVEVLGEGVPVARARATRARATTRVRARAREVMARLLELGKVLRGNHATQN